MSDFFRKPIVKTLMLKGEKGEGVKEIKKTGTDGLEDTYTITLTDGTTSTFSVANGKGISSISKTGTSELVDTYTITFNDGTMSTFTVTNGAKGDKGDKGDTGQPTDAQTESAVTKWLDNHPEATTTVQDKSLTIDKMVVGTLGYVTPEMFGAVGDGIADDTEAIINAINFGVENNKPVFAFKKYATSDTITISGLYFTFYLHGEIIYSGTDEAILITNCSRSKFIFTKISALNGTCIKMYSNSNSENRVSYCDLSFKFLNSLENCIDIEIGQNDGYCNENIIRGGWLAGGKYGIYADAKGRTEIQFKAYNVGFENVGCGFYLNGTNGCTFIAPRYAEQSKILKARNAKYILIMAMDKFYTDKIDIDDTVTGQIIAPIAEKNGGVYGFRGIFNSGYVNPIDRTITYLNALTSIDLTAEENYLTKLPRYIVVNNNCNYIKLNKMYGSTTPASIGIDEFTCKFAFDSGKDFKIYDADGNIIFNNTSNCGWKECRFKFYRQIGWTCEILNSITKLVI